MGFISGLIIGVIVGFVIGAVIGYITAALLMDSKSDDDLVLYHQNIQDFEKE